MIDFPPFIYSRAYLKIGAQLDNGCRLWNLGSERHVLEYIHDWYQSSDPPRIPSSCAIPARDGGFPKRLLEYDVAPDSNDVIHLNAENVQQWTRFILSLYKDMEFLLPIFRNNKAKASAPLDVTQVMQLYWSLTSIDWLVSENIFKALLTPELVRDFKSKYCGDNCKFYIFKTNHNLFGLILYSLKTLPGQMKML